ncbi:GIY-YIG nuclease family protein [Fodinicurvata sp. EGI_FJ10296]|uniref:GIY-YIG nuclease family protein n=1 Tax=Fodinicurvata sp. EGI_FJ10296 TaxID=3231908 RepID=UPI00345632AD
MPTVGHCPAAWVYILASRPHGALYVGATEFVGKRLWEHRNGLVAGHTRKYGICRLVYIECHASMIAALRRERQIKKWRRQWKVELIESLNPDWREIDQDWGSPVESALPPS